MFAKKIITLITLFSMIASNSFAAYFYFGDHVNLMKNCPATINIKLNTEGLGVFAADMAAYFLLSQADVHSLSIGSILPNSPVNSVSAQKMDLSGARPGGTGSFSGDGVYGTISLTPKAAADAVTLTFSDNLLEEIIIADDVNADNIADPAKSATFRTRTYDVVDRYNSTVNGGFCTPDTQPPTVDFIHPLNGSVDVPVTTNVTFSLKDNQAGVDISTLTYSIDGISYPNPNPTPDSNGVYRIETDPSEDFDEGENITTSVKICDLNVPANCITAVGTFRTYTSPVPAVCGNGATETGEQCDDGGTADNDGCSSLCLFEVAPPVECPEEVVCEDCPTCEVPAPEEELKPAAGEEELPTNPEIYLEPIAGCTRLELTMEIEKEFGLDKKYADFDAACRADIENCMLPFLMHFPNADPANNRYYSDVYTSKDASQYTSLEANKELTQEEKNAINFGTRIGLVTGYGSEATGLNYFKPEYNMTFIEMIKLLNKAVYNQPWIYEDEFNAMTGGNLDQIKKPFADADTWWHRLYLNTACDKGILDCDPNVMIHPNTVCDPATKRSLIAKYKVAYEQMQQKEFIDTDNDNLTDDDEQYTYYTKIDNPDTDSDTLEDGDETTVYGSSPLLVDTDSDTLNDGDEVNKYKTSPIKEDTDDDGYNDGIEVKLGTSPTDPNSRPTDANQNGIDDAWEQTWSLSPMNGTEDSDNDGLSDFMEYQYGTDPTNKDTDDDGLTDSEEVLLYKTNPNEFTNLSDIGMRITNITDGMILTELRPYIQGTGPKSIKVDVILRNEFGHEIVLGQTETDEDNTFSFTPTEDLRDGTFYLIAKGLDPENLAVLEGIPVHITLNSKFKIDAPRPERLSNTTITEDILLKGVKVVIGTDQTPLLIGYTNYRNRVTAMWHSVSGTSAIVADLAGGEFRIRAPEPLEYGDHQVVLQAYRESDSVMSKTVIVNFTIKEPFTQVLHGIAFGEELIFPNYVWIIIFVVGIGLVIYGVKAGKLFRKRK